MPLEQIYMECSNCRGTGFINKNTTDQKVCELCGGSGQLLSYYFDNTPDIILQKLDLIIELLGELNENKDNKPEVIFKTI